MFAPPRLPRCPWLFAALLVALATTPQLPAQTTFTVTNPGDGGPASLRTWLLGAPSGSTIVFHPSLDGQTIILSTEYPIGNRDILIDASALPNGITLSGDTGIAGNITDNFRHFHVEAGGHLELRNITLRDGNSANSFISPTLGGAILGEAGSSLTLLDCRFLDNRSSGDGGAVRAGSLTATRCQFHSNSAPAAGGAVSVDSGAAQFVECTFDANTAANGGGIAFSNSLTSTVERCTFTQNMASVGGALNINDTEVTVVNSTFTLNQASILGGAINTFSIPGVTMLSCTVTGNSADFFGGGVYLSDTVTIENSVIAENSAGQNGPDLNGTLTTASGVNFIGDPTGATGLGTAGVDYLSGDPMLAPLGDYGGPTETALPLPDSPLIDAGVNPASPPATDQRGEARLLDGDGDGTATIDIGAVEYEVVPLVVTTALDEDDGALGLGAGDSLRECLAEANADPGFDAILFDPAMDGATIELGGTELTVTANASIDASALANPITLAGGGASRILSVAIDAAASLDTLTLIAGDASGDPGGAILNEGELSLHNLTFTGNLGSNGGAISNEDGALLQVESSLFTGNKADTFGGAVFNSGTANFVACRFEQNAAGAGGAIYSIDPTSATALLDLRDCEVIANYAAGSGGGVLNTGAQCSIQTSLLAFNQALIRGGGLMTFGPATVASSTIAGNRADEGGGINAWSSIEISHCTITENRAGSAGGVSMPFADETLEIQGSIVAGNLASEDPEIDGTVIGSGNLLSGDPLLLPLGDYGGPTGSMPPLPQSPALDAGVSLPGQPASDQRGLPRVLDGDGDSAPVIDIGAVEADPSELFFTPSDGSPDLPREGVRLAWTFEPEATSYKVFLGTDPVSLASIGTTASGSFTLPPLSADTSYYWLIEATDGESFSSSAVRSFSTRPELVVTTAADEDDGALGLGSGDSLREVLAIANCRPDFDSIRFDPALEGVSHVLAGNELEIRTDLSIDGSMLARNPVISANQLSRILVVAPASRIHFRAIDLRDGSASDGSAIFIYPGSEAVIRECSVSDCSGGGAAIFSVESSLLVSSSAIHDNVATSAAGAAILASGQLRLENSTISNNTSALGYALRLILCEVEIEHCTISEPVGRFTILGQSTVSASICNSVLTPGAPEIYPPGALVNDRGNVFGDELGLLFPLDHYAGRTPSRPPDLLGPLIDTGVAGTLSVDQHGFSRLAGPAPDVGAVEAQEATVVTNTANDGAGSLRSRILVTRIDGTVSFDPALDGETITLLPTPSGNENPLGIGHHLDASALPGGLTISGGTATSIVRVIDTLPASLKGIHLTLGSTVGSGGAISNNGDLTLEDCTISRCLAMEEGGAILNFRLGNLTLVNTTIAENFAGLDGAAIMNLEGSIVCRHVTVTDNESIFGSGGGLFNDAGTLILENAIVAGNEVFLGDDNVAGPFTELGNNLLTGDPRLAPLADYGGPTLTRPPLPGSPALEGAVLLETTPDTDQIGNPRPSGPLPDIGAVEAVSVGAALATLTDSEPDGIPDILEGPGSPYPHLDPTIDDSALDSDGDGTTDAHEIADMTDPLDFNDYFRILHLAPAPGFDAQLNPLVELTLATFPGLTYSFETDALLQNFQPLPGSAFTADDFQETVQLLLAPNRDFLRGRRE